MKALSKNEDSLVTYDKLNKFYKVIYPKCKILVKKIESKIITNKYYIEYLNI